MSSMYNLIWTPINLTIGQLATLLILGAIPTVIVFIWYRNRSFYKLASKIPGPPTVPFLGNTLDFISINNTTLIDRFLQLMDQFNGTARIWLGSRLLIHISNPVDIETCLNSSKLIEKNEMYSFFDDVLGQGIFNASGDIWKKHRRIIAPTFANSVLKNFVDIFVRHSETLANRLEKYGNSSFNIFPFLRDCTLDFITETAMETNIDAQGEAQSFVGTLAAERMMNITFERMFKLWLHPNQIFYLTKNGREYITLKRRLFNSVEPLLLSKKIEMAAENSAELKKDGSEECQKTKKSFYRLLSDLNISGANFSDKELRDEVITIIITGYETTATTIAFVLVMLGIHQDVQERLYEEICAIDERLNGRKLEADDFQQFHYMDMVIKETLRLYPVGPFIYRKATADVPLATCTVPKGASVGIVIIHTHRNPAIWNNPDQFNPDNFLPEQSVKRHPYSYYPFSAGPRSCIGQKYAQISMRVMLYQILSKYRIHCDKKMEDIGLKVEVTLKMVDGFNIRIEPRKKV